MGDNERQIIRNEETVVAGQPEQTTVSQTETSTGQTVTPAVDATPVASANTVETTTTSAARPTWKASSTTCSTGISPQLVIVLPLSRVRMRGASPDDGHLTERRTSEREQNSADLSAGPSQ